MPSSSRFELRDTTEARRRLRISVTEACNFRCFFCHGDGGNVRHFSSGSSKASPSDLLSAMCLAAEAGITKVKLSGGEPLLYHHGSADIVRLVEVLAAEAERLGIELSLVSNGALLTSELASRLKAAGLRRITISLHAASESTFEAYSHVEGSVYGAILRGISNAVQAGLAPVKLNSVVYFSRKDHALRNVHEMKEVLRIGGDLGVSEVKFFVVLENKRLLPEKHRDTFVFWDDPVFFDFYPRSLVHDIQGILSDHLLSDLAFPGSFRAIFRLEKGGVAIPEFSFQNLNLRRAASTRSSEPAIVPCSCQEGSYALRLLSDGTLKSCLWSHASRNLFEAMRSADRNVAKLLLEEALAEIHVSSVETVYR